MSTEGVSGVTSSIFSLMKEEEMKHCKCLLTTTTSAHDNAKKSSKLCTPFVKRCADSNYFFLFKIKYKGLIKCMKSPKQYQQQSDELI